MEKTSRKENKLLNRVEIGFQWKHDGKSTPSRKEVMDLVATLEPGSKTDLIVVKDCKTRFGQPLTTGMAFIYGDEESMKVEPEYIHKRHESFRSTSAKEETPVKAEVPDVPEESAESSEEDGGEQ
jgi:ribosomal protein S24E